MTFIMYKKAMISDYKFMDIRLWCYQYFMLFFKIKKIQLSITLHKFLCGLWSGSSRISKYSLSRRNYLKNEVTGLGGRASTKIVTNIYVGAGGAHCWWLHHRKKIIYCSYNDSFTWSNKSVLSIPDCYTMAIISH